MYFYINLIWNNKISAKYSMSTYLLDIRYVYIIMLQRKYRELFFQLLIWKGPVCFWNASTYWLGLTQLPLCHDTTTVLGPLKLEWFDLDGMRIIYERFTILNVWKKIINISCKTIIHTSVLFSEITYLFSSELWVNTGIFSVESISAKCISSTHDGLVNQSP